MKRGDLYEFHSAPTGEVWTYELESVMPDEAGFAGVARLRNVHTDAISNVLNKFLRTPDGWPSKSYWKRVEA